MEAGKSKWDAREDFCKRLQNLNEEANNTKLLIERRKKILDTTRTYLSVLRMLYRNLRPFLEKQEKKQDENEEKETKKWDKKIREWERELDVLEKKNQRGKNFRVKQSLINELEKFHNRLSYIRFDNSLIVPVRTEEETGFI